jgi:hypothetical protein
MFWGREKSCPPPGIHILDCLAHNLFAIMTSAPVKLIMDIVIKYHELELTVC